MSDTGLSAPKADLPGPEPCSDPLACYDAAPGSGDIYNSAPPAVVQHWRDFAAGLAKAGQGDLRRIQAYIDRHVDDLGLAFRVTGDEQERPWPLAPMPIIIGAQEWHSLEAGLVQRANLLEAVIADIYGEQQLVFDGRLPASIVTGSANFASRMVGMKPNGGYFLNVYAVDLARGPTGEWRVLADRVRLPTGIGYALENRLAMARATGDLLASIGTRRQADFFEALRHGIAAACARVEPRIGLLTPGRFNQSYPEQAHLARHLGFSLVEGRDLVVRDGRLFVRTIAGLKRIDALWRWINTRDIDPLHFDSRSHIGVPNLLSACAEGGVAIANWPGAGVIDSRAMSAFLPRLCKSVLSEPLKLPNVATWWCGQAEERQYVLDNLGKLIVSAAFGGPVSALPGGRSIAGSELSPEQRSKLVQAIDRRPMDYAAQEIVNLSTTPCLVEDRLEPRSFTLRAFLARDGEGRWVALAGGFGRVSDRDELRTSLMGLGDLSADVCIVEDSYSAQTVVPPALAPPAVRRADGALPSQSADNLFWLGRYCERAHQTALAIRTLLDTASGQHAKTDTGTATARLSALLERWSAVPPGSASLPPLQTAITALTAKRQPGSVAALVETARQIALLLRDRLSRDTWRVIHRPLPDFKAHDPDSVSAATGIAIERFAAFARLMADSMARTPAWRFLDMGISLERASLIVQASATMIPGSASAEDLSALLELVDGQSLYRSRYLTMPFIAPVLDMVLLDPVQPRGLAFQISRLAHHLAALPNLRDDGMMELPLRLVRELRGNLEGITAENLDQIALQGISARIAELSDAISRRYFLQEETGALPGDTAFLA
ncbi:MAG: circularly permuted type 2 ATP-grasp protein [Novosphingobium sp.]